MKDNKDLRPAPGETGRDRYDPVSQALHWATAGLVLASFALRGGLHNYQGLSWPDRPARTAASHVWGIRRGQQHWTSGFSISSRR